MLAKQTEGRNVEFKETSKADTTEKRIIKTYRNYIKYEKK